MAERSEPMVLIKRIVSAVADLRKKFDLPLYETTKIMTFHFPNWDWKEMLQGEANGQGKDSTESSQSGG